MPANYAHYRFGVRALAQMSPDLQRPIQRFRRMYDMGLHGPDLFLYDGLWTQTALMRFGRQLHGQSGREFFTGVCDILKTEPTEAGRAYLYGLLCHYCLDSVCRPLVLAEAAPGDFTPAEMETEFDRFLLKMDGLVPPHTQNFSNHMKLTRGECVTAAKFYPTVSPEDIHRCVKNMAISTRILAQKNRNMQGILLKLLPKRFSANRMLPYPNKKCGRLDKVMLELYEHAFDKFPTMVEQFAAHLDYNAPLGEEFDNIFG